MGIELSIEDKRLWIGDTLYYMGKNSNKELYIEDYGSDMKALSDEEVNELFELMINNDDIDLSDLMVDEF